MRYLLISLLLLVCACQPPASKLKEIRGKTMGTTYTIKYVDKQGDINVSQEVLQGKVTNVLEHVNNLMSTYIAESELSRLNKASANEPFSIHPETAYVIEEALMIGEKSQGALDITVGPLVNLWGFGPSPRTETAQKIPSEAELNEMDAYVGLDRFILKDNAVVKQHPAVYIDLSTVAKGYGVDRLAELLEEHNINHFLVEIGGEMRLSGTKPDEQPWLVAIEKPVTNERAIQRIINIGDNSIASSGDYRNYFVKDNKRYSHLIDPSTKKPITHNLVSVTVISEKSISADGYATAFMVMGVEKGLEMAEKEGIAALFIYQEDDQFKELTTTEYKRTVITVR